MVKILGTPRHAHLVLTRAIVPGSSPRMIEKSRNLLVDNVTYDLEDSVSMDRKPAARTILRNRLNQTRPASIKDQGLRINSVSSGLAEEDLNEVVCALLPSRTGGFVLSS